MDGREYLNAYVKKLDGLPKAAAELGIPYPTLAAVCNGTRGISKNMARRLVAGAAARGDKLDPNKLVWVEQKAA